MDEPLRKAAEVVPLKPVSVYDNFLKQDSDILKEGMDLSDKYAQLSRSTDSLDQMQRLL